MSRAVMVLLVVGLVLRIGWAVSRPGGTEALRELPDQVEYLTLGKNLLGGSGLSFVDERFGTVSYAYRTPGYPAFVAMLGGTATAVRVGQAVIDTLTAVGVWLLARRLVGGEGRGGVGEVVAVGLTALSPMLIYFSGLVLTETVFTALVVWGVVGLTGGKDRSYFAGVAVLAVGVLVRPGAAGLPVVMAVVAAMARAKLPRWPGGAVAAACVGLVLLPWAWRNHRVLGEWVWTSTNAGFTAYDGFNPAADGSSDQSFVGYYAELREMTETQRNHYLLKLAEAYRAEHPGRVWELALAKAGRTWSPVPLSDANRGVARQAVSGAYFAVLMGLAGAGLWKGRLPVGMKVLLLTPAVYVTVAAAMSVGSLRYRVPTEPLLAVLAGAGAAAVLRPQATATATAIARAETTAG